MSTPRIEEINAKDPYKGLSESEKLFKLADETRSPFIYVYADGKGDRVTHTHYECRDVVGDSDPFPEDSIIAYNKILVYFLGEPRKILTYSGKTVEEAREAAEAARVDPQLYRGTKVVSSPKEGSAVMSGKTFQEAFDLLSREIACLGAFNVQPVQILEEGQVGSEEVQAWSEQEARDIWIKTKAPQGVTLDELKMISAVKPGVLGMGKKPGEWSIHWHKPYKLSQRFTLPAKVIVLVADADARRPTRQPLTIDGRRAEPGADLSRLNAATKDFTEANLERVNFSRSNLNSCNFIKANLRGANFSQASIKTALFVGADLREANFSDADMMGSNLGYANVEGTIFNHTRLDGTILNNMPLKLATIINCTFSETQETGMTRVTRLHADLTGAYLAGINFVGAWVGNSVFRDANLSSANLQAMHFQEADLQGANLQGANLRYAMVQKTNLSRATLCNANLSESILNDTDFTGADMRNCNLSGSATRRTNLRKSILKDANLEGADLNSTDLMDANLENANLKSANLKFANLSGANLNGANLEGTQFYATIMPDGSKHP